MFLAWLTRINEERANGNVYFCTEIRPMRNVKNWAVNLQLEPTNARPRPFPRANARKNTSLTRRTEARHDLLSFERIANGVGRSAFRPRIHKARLAVVIRFRDCPRNCACHLRIFHDSIWKKKGRDRVSLRENREKVGRERKTLKIRR